MAKNKSKTLLIKLVSTADTGYFYVRTRKRIGGELAKLSQIKYDPTVKRHVLFVEQKLK